MVLYYVRVFNKLCTMMRNNTTIAPMTDDTDALFALWRRNHVGGKDDFFAFMTTPSGGRDRFLAVVKVTGTISGRLIINNVTAQ